MLGKAGFCLSSALELQSDRAINIVASDNTSVGSAETLYDGEPIEVTSRVGPEWLHQLENSVGPEGLYRLLELVGLDGLYQHDCLSEFETCLAKLEQDAQLGVLFEKDTWIADTGASNHGTFSDIGGRNVQMTESSNLGFSGEAQKVHKLMDIPGQFVRQDGSMGKKAVLTGVGYTPSCNFNLLSLTKLMQNGWKITRGDSVAIELTNSSTSDVIIFDHVVKTRSGAIYATKFVRDVEVTCASTETGTRMNVTRAHALLGHMNEEDTRRIAKELGWTITRGKLSPCEHCLVSKARQKNVAKVSTADKSTTPGERVYLDGTKLTVPKSGGGEFVIDRKIMTGIVDEATGKKWLIFTPSKNKMVEPAVEWLTKMKGLGRPIRMIRVDPGGENVKLEKRLKNVDCAHLTPIQCEMTARDTPQHNSLVELAFPFLVALARAMMTAAHIPDEVKPKVAIEAIQTACQLDGLKLVELEGVTATRDVHMYGKNPSWTRNMRTFGEAGVVTEGKDKKLGNRGITMMFAGYPSNREHDTVRMYNPITNRIITTRDVIWLKQFFYKRHDDDLILWTETGTPVPIAKPSCDATDEVEVEEAEDEVESTSDSDESEEEEDTENTIAQTIRWADELEQETTARGNDSSAAAPTRTSMRSNFGVAPTRLVEEMNSNVTVGPGFAADMHYMSQLHEINNAELMALEVSLVGAGFGTEFGTEDLKVLNFRQAMKAWDKEQWIDEIMKEYERFQKFGVFTPVKRSDLPTGIKPISTTWAFKRKANGVRRGRLNARGFEQVDGVHYSAQDIAAPVTNPFTVRVLLDLLCMNPKWISRIVDVEGAFLQGKFENGEVIYSEVPDGMEECYGLKSDWVLLMNVPVYGTKQASACFYKALVRKNKDRGYQCSMADTTLYFIVRDGRLSCFVSWVDDMIIFGEAQDVALIEADLMKSFISKSEGEMKEYVGNKIDITTDPVTGLRQAKFTQPVLVQKLRDMLGETETSKRVPRTPAKPSEVLHLGEGLNPIEPVDASFFRSMAALCMYMMQWSRPECSNAARGCSRVMSNPQVGQMDSVKYMARYIVGTPNRGLVLAPKRLWDGDMSFEFELHGRSDSDYASCKDDRRSVTGSRVFMEGAPVAFRSNTQKFVTLSVTEAESGAGVTTAQDMMFTYRLLTSMGLKVKLPMLLEMDNKGAVDLANNYSVGGRTRHVDVRFFYLRELKEEGLMVIKHVPGVDNDADIFTKNVDAQTFERHLPVFVGHDEYMDAKTPE